MLSPCLRAHPDGCVLSIRVIPNARKDGPDGLHGDAIKFRLRAPPVEGKANTALIQALAKLTGLSRSAIQILSGETSRNKRILFIGLTPEAVQERLTL